MTQRDGTGREVGGGFRIGDMCTPVVDASLGHLDMCLLHLQDKNELIYDLCLKNLTSEKKTMAEVAF